MSIYMPKPKNYEDKSGDSSSIVNSVLENTPKGEIIRYTKCVQCGQMMKSNAKFCPECGHDVSLPPVVPEIDEEKTAIEYKKGVNCYKVSMVSLVLAVLCGTLGFIPYSDDLYNSLFILITPILFIIFISFLVSSFAFKSKVIYKENSTNYSFQNSNVYNIQSNSNSAVNAGVAVGAGLSLFLAIGMIIMVIMCVGFLLTFASMCLFI